MQIKPIGGKIYCGVTEVVVIISKDQSSIIVTP